jgi:NAD(P)-dependent dehydrogenase (short-subunit alcohol dehydrogenase family)
LVIGSSITPPDHDSKGGARTTWAEQRRGCSRRRALKSSSPPTFWRGGDATATKIDVTNEPDWIGLIANAVASYDRLDILVNNSGISEVLWGILIDWRARIASSGQTDQRFLGTRLAAEEMAKTSVGSIVNIISIMGFVGSTTDNLNKLDQPTIYRKRVNH